MYVLVSLPDGRHGETTLHHRLVAGARRQPVEVVPDHNVPYCVSSRQVEICTARATIVTCNNTLCGEIQEICNGKNESDKVITY